LYFSEKISLLFIACPKTSSTSVESYLMDLDPSGQRFRISHDDIEITSEDVHHVVIGHARAWDLKEALGEMIFTII
jgi:hypothetical protein